MRKLKTIVMAAAWQVLSAALEGAVIGGNSAAREVISAEKLV
jgi:hypothetical protein